MSEPAKKIEQVPESYSPKDKPEIIRMTEGQSQSKNLTENVLNGIPFMGYGNPSAVCYLGSVMLLMDYLNDPIDAEEAKVLTGTAFCFPWEMSVPYDEVSVLAEIPQRIFAALGYESEYIYETYISINPRQYNKDFYIKKSKILLTTDTRSSALELHVLIFLALSPVIIITAKAYMYVPIGRPEIKAFRKDMTRKCIILRKNGMRHVTEY
ncbi:MAG: hypothetical protein A2Y17_04865 [Clostridiales bacterium GWF2_38_85]|nr:MAG: hypothetical protein A2Y17_04865 [Clostridiales bacterium GWF2_38_85]HBL84381.1 hypothetical protein [Clostridiales bacterium]